MRWLGEAYTQTGASIPQEKRRQRRPAGFPALSNQIAPHRYFTSLKTGLTGDRPLSPHSRSVALQARSASAKVLNGEPMTLIAAPLE
jgi:hypothetical protein